MLLDYLVRIDESLSQAPVQTDGERADDAYDLNLPLVAFGFAKWEARQRARSFGQHANVTAGFTIITSGFEFSVYTCD